MYGARRWSLCWATLLGRRRGPFVSRNQSQHAGQRRRSNLIHLLRLQRKAEGTRPPRGRDGSLPQVRCHHHRTKASGQHRSTQRWTTSGRATQESLSRSLSARRFTDGPHAAAAAAATDGEHRPAHGSACSAAPGSGEHQRLSRKRKRQRTSRPGTPPHPTASHPGARFRRANATGFFTTRSHIRAGGAGTNTRRHGSASGNETARHRSADRSQRPGISRLPACRHSDNCHAVSPDHGCNRFSRRRRIHCARRRPSRGDQPRIHRHSRDYPVPTDVRSTARGVRRTASG